MVKDKKSYYYVTKMFFIHISLLILIKIYIPQKRIIIAILIVTDDYKRK